jgi:hypothetical protein
MTGVPGRRPPIFGVLPHLPAASTRSSLLPRLMTNYCREQATVMMLIISGANGFVQELAQHFRAFNGCMLWKLTSAARSLPRG